MPSPSLSGKRIRLYYDPRGQVVRTVNPDGSEQRVLFGKPQQLGLLPSTTYSTENLISTPWESFTYDANDLAALTHPLGSGVPVEHHYTPKSIQLDSLGRTVKTTEHKATADGEDVVMKYEFDIRGNLTKVTDALDRTVFTHVYDLKPKTGKDDPGANVLQTVHIDSGTKTALFDATFKPVELKHDARGVKVVNAYDMLNRPIKVWAQDNTGEGFTQRQYLRYGDSSGLTDPEDDNLLGKLYRHYDEAGVTEFEEYDFKGNLLKKKRQVIKDDEILGVFNPPPANWEVDCYRVEWDPGAQNFDTYAAGLLDSKVYETDMLYDALNRVTKIKYPEDQDVERKELLPEYNRAGALEKITFDGTEYVKHIAYNAKGQRLMIAYGNEMMTRYKYDESTFRLKRLKSEKYENPLGEPFTFTPQSGTTKQDFKYDYDLAGNIVGIKDRTPECGVAGTDSLDREFEYDALYRLLGATGRENAPGVNYPVWHNDYTYRPDVVGSTRAYTQNYSYDKMGNILELQHVATGGNFTREFSYDSGKNTLAQVTIGSDNFTHDYDASGNLIKENSNRHFEWDFADRMRSFYDQTGTAEPTVYSHYLYDAQGNRTKKIIRKPGDLLEVTVYIDGVYEHSYIKPTGTTIDSNKHYSTLHVMEGRSRIVTLRVGDDTDDSTPPIKYNLEDHLGSSNVQLETNGALIAREEYYPFGETSFDSYTKKRYSFCGKEKDGESKLYYYGARYYSAWICRFVSTDPMAAKYDFYTPYQYAGNKPIISIDLDGLEATNETGQQAQAQQQTNTEQQQTAQEQSDNLQGNGIFIMNGEVYNIIPKIHTVQEGETIASIAMKYDISVEELCKVNQLGPQWELSSGVTLNIPGHYDLLYNAFLTNSINAFTEEEFAGVTTVEDITPSGDGDVGNMEVGFTVYNLAGSYKVGGGPTVQVSFYHIDKDAPSIFAGYHFRVSSLGPSFATNVEVSGGGKVGAGSFYVPDGDVLFDLTKYFGEEASVDIYTVDIEPHVIPFLIISGEIRTGTYNGTTSFTATSGGLGVGVGLSPVSIEYEHVHGHDMRVGGVPIFTKQDTLNALQKR